MDGPDVCKFWCLVDGETVPFGVNAATSTMVDDLKKMIKQERVLYDIGAPSLVLWKLSDLEPLEPEATLAERIKKKGGATTFATKLTASQELSTLFPKSPIKGHLHILVQLPSTSFRKHPNPSPAEDDGREVKRKQTAPHEAIQMLPSDNPLYKLWVQAREPEPFFFRYCTVDPQDVSKFKLPSSYIVLEGGPWVQQLHAKPSFTDILIRDEYREALRAIMEWFLHRKVTKNTVEVEDTAEVEDTVEVEDTAEVENTAEVEDTMEVDDERPAPLENPFLNVLTGPMLRSGAFILLGNPGIGKTVFLYLLLVLRLQARLPTIYQSRDTRLYYFDEKGVSWISFPQRLDAVDFTSQFDPSTWCLIDSNQNLTTVPVFIQDLGLFIVQASPPHPDHFNWKDKASKPVLEYYMKSWTPSELLVGRMLQNDPCSAVDIAFFAEHYGTSARLVYTYASDALNYEAILTRKTESLTYETLDSLIKQSSALDLSAPISHFIILLSPGTSRNTFKASFASRHIYEKIRDMLSSKRLEPIARLYEIFVRISATKSAAGLISDGKNRAELFAELNISP